ncbi:MAG: hypothetical protein D6813_05365 [Calditrichaeota bacterium]|nr:MAG: hypothetical protein D6813_05365 [Calditrichota bacterium]
MSFHTILNKTSVLIISGILFVALAITPVYSQKTTSGRSAQADTTVNPMAVLFEKKCYSCHNIGGGDKKGPDLKGVTERRSRDWIIDFIHSPTDKRKKGDPIAVQLFEKYAPEVMPDQDLSVSEILSLLDFIEDLSKKNKTFVPSAGKLVREPRPEDVPLGVKLFNGEIPFKDRAPHCISCHSVNGVGFLGGGTLGPDLTKASVKFSDAELVNILQNPTFPSMSVAFAGHHFDDEELVRLVALFRDAQKREPTPSDVKGRIVWIGVLGLVFFLLLMNKLWQNRLKGVRRTLVGR